MSLGVAWAFPGCSLDVTWVRPGFLLGVALGPPPLVVSWLSPGCLLGVPSAFPHETFHNLVSNANQQRKLPSQGDRSSKVSVAQGSQRRYHSIAVKAWLPQHGFHRDVPTARFPKQAFKDSKARAPKQDFHTMVTTTRFSQQALHTQISIARSPQE